MRRKPGPRRHADGACKVITLSEIAKALGISERTAHTAYHSALAKLRAQGALGALRVLIRAAAYLRMDVIQCGSVECRPDFIDRYGDR